MTTLMAIEEELLVLQDSLENMYEACDLALASSVSDDSRVVERPRICQLLQLGILRRGFSDLEHQHSESPFRQRALFDILDTLEDAKDDVPSTFKDHEKCFKFAVTHKYASKLLKEISGLDFDKSWNMHHGKRMKSLNQ